MTPVLAILNWYMENNFVAHSWETDRLIITDTVESDASDLQIIYEEHFNEPWAYDRSHLKSDYMTGYIANPELPPNGTREMYRLQTIRLKEDQSIIGYLDVYHGWPRADVFWLGDLYLLSKFQGEGLGSELVNQMIADINKAGTYKYMRCNVSLKNWPGLRFWARIGFNHIVGYTGDKQYSVNTFADITLELNVQENFTRPQAEWMTDK